MTRDITITKDLLCKLTDKEIFAAGKQLAGFRSKERELDDRKKRMSADLAAEDKTIQAEISKISQVVSTGEETRQVKCRWEYDWEAGKKHLRRLDTEEIIQEVDITDAEKQEELDMKQDEDVCKLEAGETPPEGTGPEDDGVEYYQPADQEPAGD